MATATQKSRAIRQAARHAAVPPAPAAITFRVFEDNGGRYRWTLLGPDGDSLAHSRPYAAREKAARAALVVRDGAATARFEADVAIGLPFDVVARGNAGLASDDADAERWLDEGGSFSSQEVTQ